MVPLFMLIHRRPVQLLLTLLPLAFIALSTGARAAREVHATKKKVHEKSKTPVKKKPAPTEAKPHATPTPTPETPAASTEQWTLLIENPRLWKTPAGERHEAHATAAALSHVAVLATAEGEAPTHVRWSKVKIGEMEGWLPEALIAPPPLTLSTGDLERIGTEPVDRDHGIAHDYSPPDLVTLPQQFAYEDRPYRLRKIAADALAEMIAAAASAGVHLKVVSGFRDYAKQRELYLKKIETFGYHQITVAKPGHSEHQLGTAVDLTDGEEKHLLEKTFGETPAGKWLAEHGPEFGFAVSYTAANQPLTGYQAEPWHYRYYGKPEAARRHARALAGPAKTP